jgi:hypothetical protein
MGAIITARRAAGSEAWITARAIVCRGWLAMPHHAIAGRHASAKTTRGRRVLAAVYGIRRASVIASIVARAA